MPAPTTIRTPRLELARWREHEFTELRAVLDLCDAHLRPWIPFMRDEPRSLDDTRARVAQFIASFDEGQHFRYVVRDRGTGAFVGEVMLLTRGAPGTLEIGYWLHQDQCGRGYAKEATAALLPVAFEDLGAARVAVVCDEHNAPSIAVAHSLGVTFDELRELVEDGAPVRLMTFVLPREVWLERRA
ncbi:MAG: GNAT family N-acetyltransferase [Planctomycetes bacterium]|nr:GNAT family N-acetyltransferase [Planctomycetota bacterium]MCB9886482.1 GNAT family N-acetyltransferase [Planctomycetota bacterium]